MVAGFALAFALSLLLTRFVRDHARRFGLFDTPDARKVHREPIPRLGGIAIVAASVLSVVALVALKGVDGIFLDRPLIALLGGGVAMHLWGIVDDVHPMRARFKLAGQLAIASGTYVAGLRVPGILLPFADAIALPTVLSAAFTITWLIAITNALNLIDGMDGLAGGVAVFALVSFCFIGNDFGRNGAALLAITLAGATAGFLRYNFHPGTIFLGDSGSLFLGFMLAGLSLMTAQSPSGPVAITIPLVTLGLPVLDTALTIVRRYLSGQGIFVPDRGHIHHRLLEHLLSTRKVSLILYSICAALAVAGFVLAAHDSLTLVVLLLTGMGALFLLQTMRIYELEELSHVIRRGVRQRNVIGRSVRLREAANQLRALDELHEVFEALEHVFSVDGTRQVEVRLRRDFVRKQVDAVSIGRADDELPIWSWSCNGGPPSTCWEISLPLTSPDYERIGCLVIWEDGDSGASLSHLRVVREHLSTELQRKLYLLARDGAITAERQRPNVDLTTTQAEPATAASLTPVEVRRTPAGSPRLTPVAVADASGSSR